MVNSLPLDADTVKALTRELKFHAKALGIPAGSAEAFIDETIKSVQKSLRAKPTRTLTEGDLTRMVVRELKKYNADFAYIYEKYDTII